MKVSELIDLGFQGNIFTWSNMQIGRDNILERASANYQWRNLFPRAIVYHGARVGSDHAPIILDFDPVGRRKHIFRFESSWLQEEECKNIVENSWSSGCHRRSH